MAVAVERDLKDNIAYTKLPEGEMKVLQIEVVWACIC